MQMKLPQLKSYRGNKVVPHTLLHAACCSTLSLVFPERKVGSSAVSRLARMFSGNRVVCGCSVCGRFFKNSSFRLILGILFVGVLLRGFGVLYASPLRVFDMENSEAFYVAGDGAELLRLDSKEADDGRFGKVLQVEVLSPTQYFPKVQVGFTNEQIIPRGKSLLAHFYLRAVESGNESGEVDVQFEVENRKTFDISTQYRAHAVGEWEEFYVPFRAIRDLQPGEGVINFRVGGGKQVLQLAGLTIDHYSDETSLSELPATSVNASYTGMEADASWRVKAEQDIRRYRMVDFRLVVRDQLGQPVPNAKIHLEQRSHAFKFGSAVQAHRLVDGQQLPEYRAVVAQLFNTVVLENDLKWGRWLSDSEMTLKAIDWLTQHDIHTRGHTLVWANNRRVPASLKDIVGDADELRKAILEHIDDATRRTAPHVFAWDVVNEPFRNRDFMNLLGDQEMVAWFKAARNGAPGSTLFLNDYGIVTGGGLDVEHQATYKKTVSMLLDEGAPIDGLGFQGHHGRILTPPERMLAILDDFSQFGLEIQMTEYSTQVEDADLAAQYLGDSLKVFFSHPSVTGFFLWGFHEGHGFQHTGRLVNREGGLTPAGKVWMELLYDKWWSDLTIKSGSDGRSEARIFKGNYRVEIEADGYPAMMLTIDVNSEGEVLSVVLPVVERNGAVVADASPIGVPVKYSNVSFP